jgi:hypothetical protein
MSPANGARDIVKSVVQFSIKRSGNAFRKLHRACPLRSPRLYGKRCSRPPSPQEELRRRNDERQQDEDYVQGKSGKTLERGRNTRRTCKEPRGRNGLRV